jgi:8-oxo-dGTP pyrophosphatase MutT (NUDIX family)
MLEPDDPHDPWTTLSSREVYANPWIRVREDQVLRPDGSPGIYGVVSMNLAVGVLALTDDDHVVLVGQWRYTLGAYSWELVEGGSHDGEDSLTAAKRELAEEAGYEAGRWARLGGDLAVSNSVTDEIAHLWICRQLSPVPPAPEPTEKLELRHLPVDDVVAMVDRGLITDVMTVVGLSVYDRMRRAGLDPFAER